MLVSKCKIKNKIQKRRTISLQKRPCAASYCVYALMISTKTLFIRQLLHLTTGLIQAEPYFSVVSTLLFVFVKLSL